MENKEILKTANNFLTYITAKSPQVMYINVSIALSFLSSTISP